MKLHRGKLAILAIGVVALAAAAGSVWWHFWQGHRAHAFWGTEAAVLIRHAPRVEVLQLRPADESTAPQEERLLVDGMPIVAETKDISRIVGLVHARHALIEDASFQWDKLASDCRGPWTHGLRFSDGHRTAVVVLDFECGRARLVQRPSEVFMRKNVADGLRKYTIDQLPPPAADRD